MGGRGAGLNRFGQFEYLPRWPAKTENRRSTIPILAATQKRSPIPLRVSAVLVLFHRCSYSWEVPLKVNVTSAFVTSS